MKATAAPTDAAAERMCRKGLLMNTLTIKPLTPELAADYFDFFDHRAFSDNQDWSSCYCTFFHMNQALEQQVSEEVRTDGAHDVLHRALRRRAEQFIADGTLHGYLAYVDGVAIGFCNANDKMTYARYINETNPIAGVRTKAVACFVIAQAYRGQGIATALLERVLEDAKADGYTVIEGYPKLNEKGDAFNYTGPVRLYEKLGFAEVQRFEDRALMRKAL